MGEEIHINDTVDIEGNIGRYCHIEDNGQSIHKMNQPHTLNHREPVGEEMHIYHTADIEGGIEGDIKNNGQSIKIVNHPNTLNYTEPVNIR